MTRSDDKATLPMREFVIWGQDNDSYAFREYPSLTDNQRIHQEIVPDMSGASRPGLHRCDLCGKLMAKADEPLSGLVIKKRKYDVSCTYDGIDIVSQRFKTVYEVEHLSGLVFRQLPQDPAFFAIYASKIVEFDAERRETEFENLCARCGQYESVIGVTPAFLKPGSDIGEREFCRTDLEFGSDDDKSPLVICGGEAAEALRQARLKGLDLQAVAH